MHLKKVGRKWFVEGTGPGWISGRSFPSKWKAEVGMKVFTGGGGVRDYWVAAKEAAPPLRIPHRVLAELEKALEIIKQLTPTCDEIEAFAEQGGYGVVTFSKSSEYFPPRIHDTWGSKEGGRAHIDIGCRQDHLMLDKDNVKSFIEFIEQRRT